MFSFIFNQINATLVSISALFKKCTALIYNAAGLVADILNCCCKDLSPGLHISAWISFI